MLVIVGTNVHKDHISLEKRTTWPNGSRKRSTANSWNLAKTVICIIRAKVELRRAPLLKNITFRI